MASTMSITIAVVATAVVMCGAIPIDLNPLPIDVSPIPIIDLPLNGPPVCPSTSAEVTCSTPCTLDEDCSGDQICCEIEGCGSSVCTEGVCNASNCGPLPLAPFILCEDGVSFSGFVCEVLSDGLCGPKFQPCPEDISPSVSPLPSPSNEPSCPLSIIKPSLPINCPIDECETDSECKGNQLCCATGACGSNVCTDGVCLPGACGPQLGAPLVLCEDGESVSGFFCVVDENGVCSNQFQPCPEDTAPPPTEFCSAEVCCGEPSTKEDAIETCTCWESNLCPFKCPTPQVCSGLCPIPVPFDPTFCAVALILPECVNSNECDSDEICCNSGVCGSGICVDIDGCGPDDCGPLPLAPSKLCEDGVTFDGFFCGANDDGTCSIQFNPCPEDVSPPPSELPPSPPVSSPACPPPVDFDPLICPLILIAPECFLDQQCDSGEICCPSGICGSGLCVKSDGCTTADCGPPPPNTPLEACPLTEAFPPLIGPLCLQVSGICQWVTLDEGETCCDVELLGDTNGDCEFNIQDIVEALNLVLGTETADLCTIETVDFSGDGAITIQDLVIGIECISGLSECQTMCPEETFSCGFDGLECSVSTEACQTFLPGVCGGTFPLPDGTCPPGCFDCGFGGGFPSEPFPSCGCSSFSCIDKVPTEECNSNGLPVFGPCICSETEDGIQTVSCFGV